MTAVTTRIANLERTALWWSAATVVLICLTQAFALRVYNSPDEVAHVDYAVQVWHGHLPVFEDGPIVRPEGASVPPVQWVSQHPPLPYLLMAPIVGPMVDADRVVAAGFAWRLVNVVLAGVIVLLAHWAAKPFSRSAAIPIATAFVVALTANLGRTGGRGYNDLFAIVFLVALQGLMGRALRRGLDGRLVAAICVTAAGCALTRASAAVLAAFCCAVAVAAGFWHARHAGRRPTHAIVLLLAAPATVLATSGWFYLRNLRLTGNMTGGHPEWIVENRGREFRSLGDVLTDPEQWGRLLNVFSWSSWTNARPLLVPTLLLVFLVPAAMALARWSARLNVLALLIVLTVAMQVVYATQAGGANSRYLLPVLLPTAVIVATGLTHPWWRAWALPVWALLVLADLVGYVVRALAEDPAPGRYASMPVPAVATLLLTAAVMTVALVLVTRAARAAEVAPEVTARVT